MRWQALTAVTIVAVFAGLLMWPHLTRTDRNEGEFFTWIAPEGKVATFAQQQAWIDVHHDLLLKEGDRACAWLAKQPKVPAGTPYSNTSPYEIDMLARRYLAATRADPIATGISSSGRFNLVGQAWAHLCLGTRDGRIVEPTTDD